MKKNMIKGLALVAAGAPMVAFAQNTNTNTNGLLSGLLSGVGGIGVVGVLVVLFVLYWFFFRGSSD